MPLNSADGATPLRRHPAAPEPCLVCGAQATALYQDPHWKPVDGIALRQCGVCASIFSWPIPDDDAIKRIYQKAFNYRWYRQMFATKLKDAQIRLDELGGLLGQRVLDFGGGPGYFSEAARSRGLDSLTYDPMMNAAAAAPRPGCWDSVVALHVLEHGQRPEAMLAEMETFLAPDGRLILAVPNAAGAGYRQRGMAWTWAQPPFVHIFHFTPKGLEALLRRCGFEIVEMRFHDRWDASHLADVVHHRRLNVLQRLWGTRPFRYLSMYRRAAMALLTHHRWALLEQSSRLGLAPEDRAELLVIARRRKP